MKTLNKFLKKHKACVNGYLFAKDLTLEEFLATCPRGDWILWLFARTNPRHKKLRILTAAHCANTVRHLMTDQRSIDAVDVAIKYGEGRCSIDELRTAADTARTTAKAAADAADTAWSAARTAAAGNVNATWYATWAAWHAADAAAKAAKAADIDWHAADAAADAADAEAIEAVWYAAKAARTGAKAVMTAIDAVHACNKNELKNADICRKYLPIKVWNQSKI